MLQKEHKAPLTIECDICDIHMYIMYIHVVCNIKHPIPNIPCSIPQPHSLHPYYEQEATNGAPGIATRNYIAFGKRWFGSRSGPTCEMRPFTDPVRTRGDRRRPEETGQYHGRKTCGFGMFRDSFWCLRCRANKTLMLHTKGIRPKAAVLKYRSL